MPDFRHTGFPAHSRHFVESDVALFQFGYGLTVSDVVTGSPSVHDLLLCPFHSIEILPVLLYHFGSRAGINWNNLAPLSR